MSDNQLPMTDSPAMRTPDFQAFAEVLRLTIARADEVGLSAESPFTRRAFETAQRHAMLLSQVHQVANSTIYSYHHDGYQHFDPCLDAQTKLSRIKQLLEQHGE